MQHYLKRQGYPGVFKKLYTELNRRTELTEIKIIEPLYLISEPNYIELTVLKTNKN